MRSSSQRLAHKAVVVTGAASGIGRAIAITFAQAGACVYALDIDEAAVEAVVVEITNAGGNAGRFVIQGIEPTELGTNSRRA